MYLEPIETGSQLDGDEKNANDEEEFDPWTLPEFQDVEPRWCGKVASILPVCGFLF